MKHSLLRTEVTPFLLVFIALLISTITIDALLHHFELVGIGRWLGVPGTLLILLSFGYSLRKRKIIKAGKPKALLELHERMALSGALMIMVHAGVHVYAPLPWLALVAMLVTIISGMTGKYLLRRSRQFLEDKKNHYAQQGLSSEDVEQKLFRDSVTFDLMKQWRIVHIPITIAFTLLGTSHIFTIFLFWEWR